MEFLKFALSQTNPWLPVATFFSIGVALALSINGSVHHTDESTPFEMSVIWMQRALLIGLITAMPAFCLIVVAIALIQLGLDLGSTYIREWWSSLTAGFQSLWLKTLPLVFLPYAGHLLYMRSLKPKISHLWRHLGINQTGDAANDIRVEVGKLDAKMFDPRTFYSKGKTFFGVDENQAPIYTDDAIYTKTHVKVLGPSQTGKGVFLGVELDQAIWKGWGAWFVDLKPDDFIFDVMRESAIRNNRGEIFICDLNGIGGGGYHPFKSGTLRERRERVVKTLGLRDTGTDADHYKKNARAVLDMLMPYWDGTLSHLSELLQFPPTHFDKQQKNTIFTYGSNIESPLAELRQIEALEPKQNELNIEAALLQGKIVYIRSDMQDSVVRKASTCLIEEIIQVVRRVKLQNFTKLTIDEARFMMTDTLADSLATVLSKKLLMTLAYQSVNDPKNLTDRTLNADSIKNGIETNTQITIAHRAADDDTAEWISNPTGSIQKTVTKMEKVERNKGGAEEWTGDRSVGQLEENLIHKNTIFSLPARVAVLLRPNELSQILYSCWVPISDNHGMPSMTPVTDEISHEMTDWSNTAPPSRTEETTEWPDSPPTDAFYEESPEWPDTSYMDVTNNEQPSNEKEPATKTSQEIEDLANTILQPLENNNSSQKKKKSPKNLNSNNLNDLEGI